MVSSRLSNTFLGEPTVWKQHVQLSLYFSLNILFQVIQMVKHVLGCEPTVCAHTCFVTLKGQCHKVVVEMNPWSSSFGLHSPNFFFQFPNICVSIAVFRNILQHILQYITKVRDTYTYILRKLERLSGQSLLMFSNTFFHLKIGRFVARVHRAAHPEM
jgi:hypothetical protein